MQIFYVCRDDVEPVEENKGIKNQDSFFKTTLVVDVEVGLACQNKSLSFPYLLVACTRFAY